MEQSPVVVILLCVLCLPAALPSGSEIPSGSELGWGSDSELPSGLGSELLSGSGSELPLGSELSSGSELGSGSDSELLSGLGSELTLGSGSELPLGSELPSGSRSGSELPLGSELGSGPDSELPSESDSDLPSGSGLSSELPSGSELPLGSGSDSELPSGLGSDSELPSGSELDSELPSGSGSGSEPPSELAPVLVGLRALVLVNSTSCSVTCGLGVKDDWVCEVSPAGEYRNCSLVRSRCLRDWICGLQHLRIPEGKPIRLVCLSPEAASLEGPNFGYTWQFARGLITTNDLLFRPFRNPSPSLSFSPALESHSGTYRCDVQVLSSFQLVKRIYFGLRVIPRDLVNLDFEKSLTKEQQLVASGEEPPGSGSGVAEREKRRDLWEKQWFHEAVLGVGSGVIVGILFSLGFCCLARLCRRRAAGKMNRI